MMTRRFARLLTTSLTALLLCAHVDAAQTLTGLPAGHTDTLSIQLTPTGGAVHGAAGDTVGWGFTIAWTSNAGDWLQVVGTSLGSLTTPQTNPSVLAPVGYVDYLGVYGGPQDHSVPPTFGPWSNPFMQHFAGLAEYRIADDAVVGAVDTGQISVFFKVYDGDPLEGGAPIGNAIYTYAGSDTAYVVSVDPVKTTAQRTAEVCAAVQSLSIASTLKTSLCATIKDAFFYYQGRNPLTGSCVQGGSSTTRGRTAVQDFLAAVAAQRGTGLSSTQATWLTLQGTRMQAAIDCNPGAPR